MSADDQSRQGDGRIRHLELIQTIVARMGNNSFLIKSWSLTVTRALLAYAVGNDKGSIALVRFLPVVAFWLAPGHLRRAVHDGRTPGREEAGVLRAAVSPTLSGLIEAELRPQGQEQTDEAD